MCASTNESCLNKTMNWVPAKRVQDLYQWQCNGCMGKRTIRENSIFDNVKCTFTNAVRIILGWCKGIDIDYMANMLGNVFLLCSIVK